MPTPTELTRQLEPLFEQSPCWMIEPLADQLHRSVPTVRRFLRRVGYFSSFTHNGKYYTLQSIPRFDGNGIWFCDEVGFSRAGSLTDTLVRLVRRSPGGMTAAELAELLHCRPHAMLIGLCRKGKLQREVVGRAHVYLADDEERAQHQRVVLAAQTADPHPLPAQVALSALAAFIRHPDRTVEQLAEAVQAKEQMCVSREQLIRLFAEYGLEKKLRIPAPRPGGR